MTPSLRLHSLVETLSSMKL